MTKSNKKQTDDIVTKLLETLGMEHTPPEDVPRKGTADGMPSEIAEMHGRLVTIILACQGNREMAHQAIDRAFDCWANAERIVNRETNSEDILPAKLAHKLSLRGVHTIGDICGHTIASLTGATAIDYNEIVCIERELKKYGFGLAEK